MVNKTIMADTKLSVCVHTSEKKRINTSIKTLK